MHKASILIAEDDTNLGYVIEDHLSGLGYKVVLATDGEKAMAAFESTPFDLCILDVMMPRMDGFNLAKQIRDKNDLIPILFLTAKSLEEDRLRGFEIGGDDYITKPFSIKELTYRIGVFLRRKPDQPLPPELITFGKYKFDRRNLLILKGDEEIQLTQIESDLLALLLSHSNALVKREDILVSIWGENDYFKGRSLDVFISRLRKYLRDDTSLEIRNHHGVGFMLLNEDFEQR